MLGAGHAGQEANDLLGAEHDRQLQWPFGHRDVVVVPGPPQCDLVEEAQRRGDHAQAAGGELAFLEQMDLVGADLLGAECFGRAVEVPGEGADLLAETELHPFHERVLTLQPNEISPVFEFGDSLYIVQVIERTEAQTLSFEQAKPYIQEILFQQEHETLTTQLENSLLEQSGFTVYPSVLETYLSQSTTPTP